MCREVLPRCYAKKEAANRSAAADNCWRELLWHAIDCEGAELRVFFADFSEFNIFRIGTPRVDFVHAVPNLNHNAFRGAPSNAVTFPPLAAAAPRRLGSDRRLL